ncbi:MAG: hypothetical protein WDW38_004298 [Sanguina aurantia]
MAEFAVIGRSNVGKSSLINLLTSSKNLALVSKEPGKTKCINHFIINNQWYLVDLPGYGYARLGREQRTTFEDFTREYFTERKNLAMVFLLVDGSIPPQRVDLDYVNWLTDTKVPFSIIFTKVDKRKKKCPGQVENVTEFKREVLKSLDFLPPTLLTSSMDGRGRVAVLGFMSSLRLQFERSGKLVKQTGRRGRPPLRSETGWTDSDDEEEDGEERGVLGTGVGSLEDLGGNQVMVFKRPEVEPSNTAEILAGLLEEMGVDAAGLETGVAV